MELTTLCYVEQDGKYLMMHRISKKNDVNKDKWIGIGGHFLPGETPEECLLREAREEAGITLENYRFRGILTFLCDRNETEYICLYTADRFFGGSDRLRRRKAGVGGENGNIPAEPVGRRPDLFSSFGR